MIIKIPKDTSMNDWIEVVNSSDCLVALHDYYNSDTEVYSSAILRIEGYIFGRLLWNGGKLEIEVEIKERDLESVYKSISKVADLLNGDLFYKKGDLFDPMRHLPIPMVVISRDTKYFECYDLDYIRWMAFREEDRTAILKALKLEESKEVNLKGGVDGSEFIVTPTYSGWTFIMGDDLPNLLIKGDESSSEEALTNLCKSLQKLSKQFIEVQYFEHQGKSNITGYFKSNNGKLNFGYWKSETEEFDKGRVPREIKKLHPTSAHEVASVWSIDPMDFVYLQGMAEKKSSVVVPV